MDNINNLSDNSNDDPILIKNITENNIDYELKIIYNKIDNFFQTDIWTYDYKNISNYKISKIIEHIHKLKKKFLINTKPKPVFSIDMFYHLEINDSKEVNKELNKEINKEIIKYKKDNMRLIKIHSELFYDYHKIYHDLFCLNFNINSVFDIIYCEKNNSHKTNIDINLQEIINYSNTYLNYNHELEIDIFKSKIEHDNLDNIIKKLKENFNSIKIPNLETIDLPIILLDCENFLKSFVIHSLLKKHIAKNRFDELFSSWYLGETVLLNKLNDNMSMSEFSQATKYIEPFTSISLENSDKEELIKLLVSNYLSNYFVICLINNKNNCDSINIENKLISNVFFININYKKNDIREQDDHIILYLNYLFNKISRKSIILSGDKFKYYNDKLNIFDFKMIYDFDENKTKIILTDSSNDLIKINSNIYQLNVKNIYPIDISEYTLESESTDNKLFNLIKIILEDNLEFKDKINDELILILLIIKEKLSIVVNFFNVIFDFLESKSKKDIFKLVLNETKFKNSINDMYKEDYFENINIFKELINTYLILKYIKFLKWNDEYIYEYIKIFENIIYIYDKIEDSIDKIRKLSSSTSSNSKYFKELNSLYLYMKKIGLCKKIF